MLKRIAAREGYAGLYKGLRPTLIMAVPNSAVYYTAYDEIMWHLTRPQHEDHDSSFSASSWLPAVAGGSARLLASTLTAPLEYMKRVKRRPLVIPPRLRVVRTAQSCSRR